MRLHLFARLSIAIPVGLLVAAASMWTAAEGAAPARPEASDGLVSDRQPSAIPDQQNVRPLCRVNQHPGPVTPDDLVRFVWDCRNAGPDLAFYSAAEDIYAAEARDGAWAGSLESKVHEFAASMSGAEVKGECHTSMCRYEVNCAGQETCTADGQFGWRLKHFLKGTDLGVTFSGHRTDDNVMRYYLFSLNPQSAYIEPLQDRLTKSPGKAD